MLRCENIVKDYQTSEEVVHALKGVSLSFRDSEFVSILGQSGCGKTTFLNIIGGLDQYTSGDLIINGKSTKNYADKDWDTYRNHKIGFVFQSYNLIPHQSVLSNVELALTLSGVSKEERRKRAIEALEKVGLKDQINKKPTQMSGGQMQRVAIARAIVNNPDIILADEPTGALDSHTSVQIMEILKEISKEKLVIMVTHNPDLAQQYSSRIIRLFDGQVVDDSNPYEEVETIVDEHTEKKTVMSFMTALSLSLNNLMTKKARTILVSFAGSIGIIGIALILSLSNGVQSYIDGVESDTMTAYPISIQATTMDMTSMMESMTPDSEAKDEQRDMDKIYTKSFVNNVLESIASSKQNNLTELKSYIESEDGQEIRNNSRAIEYSYGLNLNVYNEQTDSGLVQVSPNGLIDKLGMGDLMNARASIMSSTSDANEVWLQLPDEEELKNSEFELIEGNWPENYNEVVIAVDKNNNITDYALYSLGILNQDEVVDSYNKIVQGSSSEVKTTKEKEAYAMDELMDTKFKLVLNSDLFEKVNGIWIDRSEDEDYVQKVVDNATEVKVVGVIRQKENTMASGMLGGIYYSSEMRDYVIDQCENSAIVKEQKENEDINIFTGKEFRNGEKLDFTSLTDQEKLAMSMMSQDEILAYMETYNDNINATLESNLKKMGVVDLDSPTQISLYAKDFDSKEVLSDCIEDYNQMQEDAGNKNNTISYTDIVGTMISSVSTVINMISYVLIGFVSISLVVSSIMIGIITYISVLERTKEIGILRSIGASKKDISHIFNAESFIIGLASGLIGIGLTVLLNWPISTIVEAKTGVANLAILPWQGGLILVVISVILSLIAGLIPSKIASKKDPVESLRSE
ncbi:MAG: ABC transporter ATP-binding protein/permease [Erysipelotrichaceae bacterium]|uniref:ABC transporter ATP-binding protein/permease n=2 Tax=Floccifex sp. TaxID=2815810 RepID=UPI002A7476AC|nr:ABC transporter ATP-binding protein/permease [Floccifex sp.]MDD7281282.1 ABC transporter ATP-binding protein/permease [Erysipelotrichaceae bacterium]MDY2957839.1 ABC transporter ATP-binding protein/permease [Floccifex sp.]